MNTGVAESKAWSLIRTHLTNRGYRGWGFAWKHSKRVLGTCDYAKQLILLSKPYVKANTVEQVTDTILHEIAHALTPGACHGRAWKAACLRLGAKPEQYVAPTNEPDGFVPVTPKWTLTCPSCGCRSERYRMPKNTRYACVPCERKGKPAVMKTTKNY